MNSRKPLFSFGLWSLLFLWTFFGGLELAEQLQFVPEIAVEDQQGQDLDEEALSQLASGLKPDVPGAPSLLPISIGVSASTVSVLLFTVHQQPPLASQHQPSLTIHKQLSVYRI